MSPTDHADQLCEAAPLLSVVQVILYMTSIVSKLSGCPIFQGFVSVINAGVSAFRD